MLSLIDVNKSYKAGSLQVQALRGINLNFRQNEFVCILGPSGCGKTTMLNLLGGLDRYDSGDLVIGGKSTKEFTERDWDAYRNNSIGFVFQNYNLIPHQTVLKNVELALTLSGVSKKERKERAIKVLTEVGLSDQLHKKPGQMSGGQMQRVSIARALVNNPDILLADEPTGALDTETSEQVLGLIKDIAKERLVIMVTHNKYLAEKYSTRIIKLLDGNLVSDTDGCETFEALPRTHEKPKHTSMSFLTALSLSLSNLLTKKTRTFLTAFAGSIGIIGIALILALSSGSQAYINRVQEDTLSQFPIVIERTVTDMGAVMSAMREVNHAVRERDDRYAVYSNNVMANMLTALLAGREDNDLRAFKRHLEENMEYLNTLTNAIRYTYASRFYIFASEFYEEVVQINPTTLFRGMGGGMMNLAFGVGMNVWTEMLDNPVLLSSQYEVIAGRWPRERHEIVLVVDEHNEIADAALYALGLLDRNEVAEMVNTLQTGGEITSHTRRFSFDEIMAQTFIMVLSSDFFQRWEGEGMWVDMRYSDELMRWVLANSLELNISGIIRPRSDAAITSISGNIGYLRSLTEYIIARVNSSDIVIEQLANPQTDVFTGRPFAEPGEEIEMMDLSLLPEEVQVFIFSLSPATQAELMASFAAQADTTLEDNLRRLGVVEVDNPRTISIYPINFASKEAIENFIKRYNEERLANDESTITYTDIIGLMMASIATIINMVSYVLIAFVGISLVVSSIMIGIITYVSVLERTREIGILKSIGASKKDISRVFNAETLIIGFVAGSLGIAITFLLTIPANMIIVMVSGVSGIARLPIFAAALLIFLSMGLTLVSGFVPSKIAAKKDAVVALRAE